jgi:hypothetical protein
MQLHESSAHIGRARMIGERPDQVVPLTRAEADDADGSRRAPIERVADVTLHDREPLTEPAVLTVVGAMPVDPVIFGLG